jgi:excisionase family DNA binding protein
MSRIKAKSKRHKPSKPGANAWSKKRPYPAPKNKPGADEPPATTVSHGDVFTLAEAAGYLKLPEKTVLDLVQTQGLPGRQTGTEWRFLKEAIQEWLRGRPTAKDFWTAQAGAFRDDPYLDDMVKEIYRQRGRPVTEAG